MTRKTMLSLGAVLAIAAGAVAGYWHFGSRDQNVQLPGTVEVQEVRLGSRVGGRVEEIFGREGDLVKPGQILVKFEAPELEAQREQRQARVESMAAALEKMQTGARPEEKDAAVAAAEAAQAHYQRLKAGYRPEEIREAEADLRREEATLGVAQKEFTRSDRLRAERVNSVTEYDANKAEMNRSRARVASAKAHLDLLVAGSRQEDIDEAAAEVKRAQANARLLQNGNRSEDIAQAAAALAEARGQLHETEAQLREAIVRAPEQAVIEVLAVRKGDVVAPNTPIVRVLRAEDLWVKVYVPETELGRVRLGQTVDVTIDSYTGKRFAGTVMQIASESEFTPRNVQSADERRHQVFGVKVRVDNPEGVFKSGMAAEVVLPLK